MVYTFDQIEARDPSNPGMVAANAVVTIHAPGDAGKTPIALQPTTGMPLPNPVTVNDMGYGPAFIAGLDRVAWTGGEFTGFFTAHDSIKQDAVAAADRADTVYVPQTEWVRISTERPGSQVRELAMFHAFTKEGTPPAPVFTFPGAARITAAIFRVTGASQDTAVSGAGGWAATLDSTNTLGLTVQATGAPAGGITFAAAYSNTNALQGATTAVTFNGAPADVHLTSHGSGAPGASSATSQSIKVSTSTGPFAVVWGKTIANGQGLAVTIPAAPAPAWETRVMLGGELRPATLAVRAGDRFVAPQVLGTN